jgi:hypothetical protein
MRTRLEILDMPCRCGHTAQHHHAGRCFHGAGPSGKAYSGCPCRQFEPADVAPPLEPEGVQEPSQALRGRPETPD